jgi:predicted ATPase/class 3 adenylate cyclase
MSGARVTLLFTDIEGSTRLLDRLGERYRGVLRAHHRLLRDAIAGAGGREVDTAGDSFFAAFSSADAAVTCAVRAQRGLAGAEWPEDSRPRVRVGIHTGTPAVEDGSFVGLDVHRAARIMAVAHGGQVLLSEDAALSLEQPRNLLDLGHHRLKDLPAPEHLFQLLADGLEQEFPRLSSLNRSNWPTPSGELVGRRDDVERALEQLTRPEVRVLTLLGPGGVGKTRLAIEVAADVVGRYRDGVWMVALAALPDGVLMVSELARILEVDRSEGQTLEQSLADALADRELLLVLDNFEHLPAAAGVVADLLAAAPGVDVLATSREPLRIRGEQRLDVPPMTVAVAADLFEARARAVRADLVIDREDRGAIERICARLDGLPLAIELAAARVAIFKPRVLEARLGERLELPAGGRDLPARQRTLRAAIDWSYRLLEPDEQRLFAAMSPFVGGARLDTAEVMWGSHAVNALISLAEKSLVRRRDDADDEPRFWMLETVRDYAVERASADRTTDRAVAAHADYFSRLSDDAAPELIGKDQARWLDRLENDHLNLRAALEYLTQHDPLKAIKLAGNLTWFWTIRGYAPEARRRLDAVLAAAPADAAGRGLAVYGASDMAFQLHELADAHALLQEAVSLARAEGNQRLMAVALSHLAHTTGLLGDPESVHELYRQAITTAEASGDDWALAIALNNSIFEPSVHADSQLSLQVLEQALDVVRRTEDLFMITIISNNIAEEALNLGDRDRAAQLSGDALELAREIKLRAMISAARNTQALMSLERGDLEQARVQLAEAIQTTPPYAVEQSALVFATVGIFAAATHQPSHAARLWGAAERARQRIDIRETPAIIRLRTQWQPRAQGEFARQADWDEAWHAGAQLAIDDAFAIAQSAIAGSMSARLARGQAGARP